MAKILVLDDDKTCLAILRGILEAAGHEVFPLARSGRVAEAIRELNPGLVVTDLMMPGVTGGAVYHLIRETFGPDLPVIVSTGTHLKLKLPDDPLLAYQQKPVEKDALTSAVARLLERAAGNRSGA